MDLFNIQKLQSVFKTDSLATTLPMNNPGKVIVMRKVNIAVGSILLWSEIMFLIYHTFNGFTCFNICIKLCNVIPVNTPSDVAAAFSTIAYDKCKISSL